jgi:hypothetical protein
LLVIAELVGTAYYRLLRARTRDSVLDDMCLLLLKDEAQHVAFHADWLGQYLGKDLLPLERALWTVQFQVVFTVATWVAWIDHAAALRLSGSSRTEFYGLARRECIRFLHQLEHTAAAAIPALLSPGLPA